MRSFRSRWAVATTAAASALILGDVNPIIPWGLACCGDTTDDRPAILLLSRLLINACSSSGVFAFFAASCAFVRSSRSRRAAATIDAASALIAACHYPSTELFRRQSHRQTEKQRTNNVAVHTTGGQTGGQTGQESNERTSSSIVPESFLCLCFLLVSDKVSDRKNRCQGFRIGSQASGLQN